VSIEGGRSEGGEDIDWSSGSCRRARVEKRRVPEGLVSGVGVLAVLL